MVMIHRCGAGLTHMSAHESRLYPFFFRPRLGPENALLFGLFLALPWTYRLNILRLGPSGFPRETVRKGYEQRSERGFGRYTEAKRGRRATFRCPVRLRCRRVRAFSDSFSTSFGE
jgi:hypothetical protein